MAITLTQLVDDVQLNLQGFVGKQDRATHLTATLTDSSTSMTVSSTENIGKGIIEIDDELIWIDGYERSTGIITAAPYGRGYNSSDAASHAQYAKVTISPTFPRVSIKRSINDTINSVYPSVFATDSTTLEYISARNTYELPTNAISVMGLRWKTVGPTKEWLPVRRFEPDLMANTTAFTSGKSVTILDAITPGQTIQVYYSKLPSELSNNSDTLETTAGLPASMRDVIIYGAAYRLISFLDPSKFAASSPEADEIDSKRPYGFGQSVTRQLFTLYQQRLQEESLKQKQQYPVRVHYIR
jgi:hypothetical protein